MHLPEHSRCGAPPRPDPQSRSLTAAPPSLCPARVARAFTWPSCFSPQRVVDLSFLRLHRYIHSVVRTPFRAARCCVCLPWPLRCWDAKTKGYKNRRYGNPLYLYGSRLPAPWPASRARGSRPPATRTDHSLGTPACGPGAAVRAACGGPAGRARPRGARAQSSHAFVNACNVSNSKRNYTVHLQLHLYGATRILP